MQDGAALSTKYQSKRKVFGTCHVVVFANAFPDKSKLTQDRWEIVDLAKENSLVPLDMQGTSATGRFGLGAQGEGLEGFQQPPNQQAQKVHLTT